MKGKRFLSLVLAICMVITLLPTLSFAEEAVNTVANEPVELEYVTTIAALSSKLPKVTSSSSAEIGIQNGSTLRNWTLADWRTEAEDTDGNPYNTLDTSKTDSYAIDFGATKPTRVYTWYMESRGMQANFQEGYQNNRTGSNRPYVPIRIVVPAAGTYKISMKSGNRQANGAVPDVHFIKAQDGYMDTTKADAVLGTGTSARAADGYFDFSTNGGEKDVYYPVKAADGSELTVSVSEAGEYWVVLVWNQAAYDRNPSFTDTSKTEYQYLWLSGIKLTPVTPPNNQKYVFSREAIGKTADTAMPGYYITYDEVDTSLSDQWAQPAQRSMHGGNYVANGFWARSTKGNSIIPNNGNAFKINVNKAGKYNVTLTYAKNKSGGDTNIYLLKGENFTSTATIDIKSALQKYQPDGSFDCLDATKAALDFSKTYTLDLKDIELSKGDNFVIFATKAYDATVTDPNIYYLVQSLEIKEAVEEPDELSEIFILADKTVLETGATATLSTTAEYTVSGKKEITSGVTYESDNTSVATVSGNVVTAVGAGTAEITATYEGKTSGVTITVNAPAGPVTPPVATETYEYVTSFDVLNSENMHVASSDFYSRDVLRNAYGAALYNVSKMSYNATFALDKSGNPCTPYDVFKKDKTDDWEWASGYSNTQTITKQHNAFYLQLRTTTFGNTTSGFYAMLRVNVPKAGKYTLSYDGNRKEGLAAPAIYFAKDDGSALSTSKNTDQSKFVSDSTLVGYANFSDTTKTGYVTVGAVEVPTAGDYYIGIFGTPDSKIKAPASGEYQFIELTGFKLAPFVTGDDANDLESITLSSSVTPELEIGEEMSLVVTADYSRTGKELLTSGVSYVSSEASVASVDATGKIVALSAGKTTITATVSGTNVSDTMTVEVLNPDPGNGGVVREYRTTWDALSGDKLPLTTNSSLYSGSTYARNSDGGIIMNSGLMNRSATAVIDKNANPCEEWRLMNFDITDPWDMAFQKSPGGPRIFKGTNDLYLNFETATYGNTSSGTFIAFRIEVPNKGDYNFSIDSRNVKGGIASAVYLVRDDGSVKDNTGIYNILATEEPIGYHNFGDTTAPGGYNKLCTVNIPRQGEYFVIFFGDKNSKALQPNTNDSAGKYQNINLEGIKLSALPGPLAKVELGIHGIDAEGEPMPLMTEKQIEYTLTDAYGIPLEDVSDYKVLYSINDDSVATVSEDGIVSAVGNGNAVICATVVSAETGYPYISKEYNLLVAPAGKNLLEETHNPKFDTDEWVWNLANEPNAPATPKFMRTMICTEPKDGDPNNRALGVVFDKTVAPSSNPGGLTFIPGSHRIKVEPGKFYQLTFKFKANYITPANAQDMYKYFDMYVYSDPTGTSSSSIAFNAARSMDISQLSDWRDRYADWNEIVVPIAAPTEYSGDYIYLTPRLVFRPPALNIAGYDGMAWFDDFELREVGYAGVEVVTDGELDKGESGNITVSAKPYTTLGHYISLGGNWTNDSASFSASDENVIKDFLSKKLASGGAATGVNWVNASAALGGKNGSCDIFADITINGVTRRGSVNIETSNFPIKLLYASASCDPETVPAGGTTQVVPVGYLSDGSVADLTNATVTYTSLTPDIVTVDETSGVVTALRAGTGKIQVDFLLDGSGTSTTATVTVTDTTPIVSAEIVGADTVGYLRDTKFNIIGMTEGGFAADISAAEVTWNVDCDPVGGVTVDSEGMVFGAEFGATATISATVALNGGEVTTEPVTITVVKTDLRDHFIDFREASRSKPLSVLMEEDGWQIDVAKSDSSISSSSIDTKGLVATTSGVGRKLVMRVNVPYEGAYTIAFAGSYYSYNAIYGDIYVDGVYLNTYRYNLSNMNAASPPERLRTVYLTAGVHEFTFNPTVAGTRNSYQALKQLRFVGQHTLPTPEEIITLRDEYSITKGHTESLDTKIATSDGLINTPHTTLTGGEDPYITVAYESANTAVAAVSDDGIITAAGEGTTTITIKATVNGTDITKEIPVTVVAEGSAGTDSGLSYVEIGASSLATRVGKDIKLSLSGKTGDGADFDLTGASITWESADEEIATVSPDGTVTPLALGEVEISATVEVDGTPYSTTATVSVREGKIGRTYYTDEMVAAAHENIEKYSWARSQQKSAIATADRYVNSMDLLYEMIPGEGLPRANAVGYRTDPERFWCRYCGVNLYTDYGHYPWITDMIARPWKVQCPSCKRQFPSNDFAKLYELGRDEHGIYNEKLALERNAELVANGERGYAVNVLYPEIGGPNHPSTVRFSDWETTEGWGVDTGMGYNTGRTYSNGVKEIHTYIAYVMHCGIWYDDVGSGAYNGVINRAIVSLADAYLYTGDIKYGRVGAVLMDRIADVYPDYNLRPYLTHFSNSDGGAKRGQIVGSIWETYLQQDFAKAYDAFFPAYDDPQVISFLSEKAKKYNLENDKSSAEKIRQNVEDGVLREIYDAVCDCSSQGNFGMAQSALGMAAVILDTQPDTNEMIDWIYAHSESDSTSYNTGGGVAERLVNNVSRDGQGNESAMGYNRLWVTELTGLANTLARYPHYDGLSLYEHPKYVGMIQSYPYVTLVRRGVPAVGDGGGPANYPVLPDEDSVMMDSFKYTRETNPEVAKEIAQHMYFVKGGKLDNLHYDIWTKNPESLADEVEEIIDTYGEWDYDRSSMLTGYGLGILRGGSLYKSTGTDVLRDTQRDFWIYFGGSSSHNNEDALSLGVEAYGIGMTSDLGYPEATGSDPNRYQWQNPTISHNTVVVDEMSSLKGVEPHKPVHYDGKETRVKVIDVDGSTAYTQTDEYQRTVVMVDYDAEVSYGIDFFKVRGGDDHLYSFHTNSIKNPETSENLTFKQQVGGTYAGPTVPFGEDPYTNPSSQYTLLKYPLGYTWLFDIYRADNPGVSDFWLDYEIKDFRKLSRNGNMDTHLRMTMVNDFEVDEVSLANGMPPRTPGNLAVIDHFEYMLIRRKGKDLNTLFTTVIEPYNGERYIRDITDVDIAVSADSAKQPGEYDVAKAVKVEFENDRIDYVVYTQDRDVTYEISDASNGVKFAFRGIVGVYTVNKDLVNTYSYINDGDMIGADENLIEGINAAVSGKVTDFQHELSFDNWIDVEFDRELSDAEVKDLADRMFIGEHGTHGNSAFVIKSATKTGEKTARLDLGGITLIDKYADYASGSEEFIYDVAIGGTFEIPLSYEDLHAPIFDEIADGISTNVGSSMSMRVNATSENESEITYSARTLPRGASFDPETQTISWKPTAGQIGDNLFAIDATDEAGRMSTIYFTVKVHGSTVVGGGGGGATTTPSDEKENDKDSTTDVGDGVPDVPSTDGGDARFIDLGAHAWAADAINSLADEGIIKGTSENTFSPGNNITRADFAILLVRAFEKTSDNTENFSDVSESDYFAKELAIARNTGLVNGIGDNKFTPRSFIKRCDMMLMVYRVLESEEIDLVGDGVLDVPQYSDFDTVPEYAKEAVSALIGAGIVNGKNNLIAPEDNTTRAEVAVLLQRVLDFVEKK